MPNPEQNPSFANASFEAITTPNLPIVETEESVSFMGVELPKGGGGSEVPSRQRFAGIERTLTNEDYRRMGEIATALKLNQPILVEEYSGSGKTTKIEHICSLLNAEVFYANCHDFDADVLIGKMSTDEATKSGFGWQDGIVMRAIRNGGVLFLDEYNFMRGNVRARMHEVLDALLRNKETISLIENNGEVVPVHPNLRIVAAQNPPGGEFGDREVLDPAQYTRFVQLKGPSRMSKETKLARALGFINRDNKITIEPAEYLTSEANLSPDQLAEIPGIEEIIRKFVEFEDGFEEMVGNRQIGVDQPQPIYTAFERDKSRVYQFVQMFYNGDINDTFQKALRFYYSNRLESEQDRQKVEEQIKTVVYVPEVQSKRRGIETPATASEQPVESELKGRVDRELSDLMDRPEVPDSVKRALSGEETPLSPDILEQINEAKRIFGSDFVGPDEAKSAFGLEIELEVLAIPFTKEELERAKELNQALIFRLPLTMAQINETLRGKVKDGEKLLYSFDESTGKLKDDCWYKDETFFNEEKPKTGWALVSKELVPDTTNKNYLEQTDGMIDYLRDQVFKDKPIPAEYQRAIDEFSSQRESIIAMISSDWKGAAKKLEGLKITKLTRQTSAEALYDLAVYFQTTGERILPNRYTWTSRCASGGFLVCVAFFDAGGVYPYRYRPGYHDDNLGVSFSRSL